MKYYRRVEQIREEDVGEDICIETDLHGRYTTLKVIACIKEGRGKMFLFEPVHTERYTDREARIDRQADAVKTFMEEHRNE